MYVDARLVQWWPTSVVLDSAHPPRADSHGRYVQVGGVLDRGLVARTPVKIWKLYSMVGK